ncbi:Cell surface protein, partial [human gut metagenome]
LQNILVDEDNQVLEDIDGVLVEKEEKVLLHCPNGKIDGTYKIPESIEILGAGCFANSDNLTSIIIPENVKVIGDEVFSDCINLKKVVIPDSVEWIGYYAFDYCENLES